MKVCAGFVGAFLVILAAALVVPPRSSADGEVAATLPPVRVPAVTGLRPLAAERMLHRWQLDAEYGALSNLCAGLPPGGRIVQQEPSAGTLAPAFSTVTLQDSCGGSHGRGKKVRVPDVSHGATVLSAYEALRERGLRVAIPRRFTIAGLCLTVPHGQLPRPGARVRKGRVVKLTGLGCELGSPGVLESPQAIEMPDLTGISLALAIEWATSRDLYWEAADLPPLRPSWRLYLLDNYLVTSQSLAPGSTAQEDDSLRLTAERRP